VAQENRTLEPVKMGSTGLDQLSKNLEDVESTLSEGDVGEQLAKNWKNIAMAVGLAVAMGLGFNALKEGQARSLGASSERFESVQRDFQALQEKSPEGTNPELAANTARAFQDNLKAIKDLDSRSVYASFAELYESASELNNGNVQLALEKLKPFEISQLSGKLNSENLLLEQALLLKAKALLASGDGKEQGKQLLKDLALQGRVVSGEALISYLRIAGPSQELVDTALTKNPGLREILKNDLQSLGVLKKD